MVGTEAATGLGRSRAVSICVSAIDRFAALRDQRQVVPDASSDRLGNRQCFRAGSRGGQPHAEHCQEMRSRHLQDSSQTGAHGRARDMGGDTSVDSDQTIAAGVERSSGGGGAR